MKPTEAQIKEFWEGCGFEYKGGAWHYPDGSVVAIAEGEQVFTRLPSIDLNNLFKYAVPKLQDEGKPVELYAYEHEGFVVEIYDVIKGQWDDPIVVFKDKDPALALFWALDKVRINEKGR